MVNSKKTKTATEKVLQLSLLQLQYNTLSHAFFRHIFLTYNWLKFKFISLNYVGLLSLRLCLVRKIEEGKIGSRWKARKTRIVPQFGSKEQWERKERNVGPTPKNLSSPMWMESLENKHIWLKSLKRTQLILFFNYYFLLFFFQGLANQCLQGNG